jgi:hypothetical protein
MTADHQIRTRIFMVAFARSLLIGCATLLLAAPLAQAGSSAQERATATPRLGFYNCYSKGYPIVYQGSVQLRGAGRYGWGYLDTANRRLKSPRSGSYRASGNRITWSGGPLTQLYGVVKTSSKFEVWARGEKFASYWCYFKF